jgi:hypothetical protein
LADSRGGALENKATIGFFDKVPAQNFVQLTAAAEASLAFVQATIAHTRVLWCRRDFFSGLAHEQRL